MRFSINENMMITLSFQFGPNLSREIGLLILLLSLVWINVHQKYTGAVPLLRNSFWSNLPPPLVTKCHTGPNSLPCYVPFVCRHGLKPVMLNSVLLQVIY